MDGRWSAHGLIARPSFLRGGTFMGRKGFTLTEVVVSTVIVAVGLVGLLSAFLSGLLLIESSRSTAVAAADARTVFEEMRRLSSTSLLEITRPATPWTTWALQQGLTSLPNERITEAFWVPKTNRRQAINRANPPGLVEAELTVSWSERGRSRTARFTSLITKR